MLPPDFDESLWDEIELEIWKEQGYRCVVCGHYADTIHEIVPKSKNPKGWRKKENRVLVCLTCHDRIHYEGAVTWKVRLMIFRDKSLRLYNVHHIE